MTTLPVADPWFATVEAGPGIYALFERHVDGLFRANVHLVKGRDRNLLVDSGMGIGSLRAAIAPLVAGEPVVVATHAHIDHAGGLPEFGGCEILVHPAEAARLREPRGPEGLHYSSFSPATLSRFRAAGFPASGLMIDAVPVAGYDPSSHRVQGVEPSRLVEEGEVIDLGSRRFTVLHVPGHSPGSIALFDAADGTLISGDAIYDGTLVDSLPESNVAEYVRTMFRLRALPVMAVYGGHRPAFGRARMIEIIDAYIARRG